MGLLFQDLLCIYYFPQQFQDFDKQNNTVSITQIYVWKKKQKKKQEETGIS